MAQTGMTDPKEIGRQNVRLALQIFLRTILAAILSFFLYFSITAIVNGVSTHEIGYQIYEYDENGQPVLIEEGMLDEESSQEPSSQEASSEPGSSESGETSSSETTKTLYRRAIFSEVPVGAAVVRDVLSQVLMLLLLAAFPYGILWNQGDRDRNSVQFGHMREDKLRGLKVGLLAAIPSFVVYVLLLLSRLGLFWDKFILVFQLFHASFAPTVSAVLQAQGREILVTADVGWGWILLFAFTVLVLPLICWGSYRMGYRQYSISEHLIYKNTKKKRRR